MTHWDSFHNALAACAEIRIGCQTFFNNFQHTSRGIESVTPETKGRSDIGETVFSHHADQVDYHGARFIEPISKSVTALVAIEGNPPLLLPKRA